MKLRLLSIRVKNSAGRNAYGHFVVKSKGRRKCSYRRRVGYTYTIFKAFTRLSSYWNYSSHSLIWLVYFSNGALGFAHNSQTHSAQLPIFSNFEHGSTVLFSGDTTPLGACARNKFFFYINIFQNNNCAAQSPGSYGEVIKNLRDYTLIRLNSNEMRFVPNRRRVVLGSLAVNDVYTKNFMKAGSLLRRGKSPSVRGTAKNPVDHPLGGGEGKTTGGKQAVNFRGILAKGGRNQKVFKKYIFKKLR